MMLAGRTIDLKFCRIEFFYWGCRTTFADGAEVPSAPSSEPHYFVISHRCGYGDDTLSYCWEHDFCHAFVEQFLFDRESTVLAAVARGKPLSGARSSYEEMAAQTLQAWLRANIEPIIAGVDWHRMKVEALLILSVSDDVRSPHTLGQCRAV